MRLPGPKKISGENDNRILIGSIVEYEQHGQQLLGVIVGEKKDKWILQNIRGAQLELPASRLYLLPGSAPAEAGDAKAKSAFLEQLNRDADALAAKLNLEELWSFYSEEKRELTVPEAAELAFGDNSLPHHLASRRALVTDRVYFKRMKIGFEPRSQQVVESLRQQVRAEEELAKKREELIVAIVRRIQGEKDFPIPANVRLLELYAALGKSAENYKDAMQAVDEIVTRTKIVLPEKSSERTFQLLVQAGVFDPDQNLSLLRMGREEKFSAATLDEARKIVASGPPAVPKCEERRELHTVTIDNEGTRDYDDAISLEPIPGGYRIGVHIADVSSRILPGSTLEKEAFSRATSIYCADSHVPMLPAELSEGALSLMENQSRNVLSMYIDLDEHFSPGARRMAHSIIEVKKRMSYNEADAMLYEQTAPSPVRDMLTILWDATCALEQRRIEAGAAQFNRREMNVKINPDRGLTLEESNEDTPAHKLIGEMMILANETAALYGMENRLPLIYRSQEPPDVDPESQGMEIAEGPAREFFQRSFLKRSLTSTTPLSHYGLGLAAYMQSTSALRRASDLINQRQIAEFMQTGKRFYDPPEVTELMGRLENGLEEAFLVQRERNRYFLLKYLAQENITQLEAVIMKTDGPKPLAELDLIYLITPFHALTDMKDVETARKRRGEKILLRIEVNDPRTDTLLLREIAKE